MRADAMTGAAIVVRPRLALGGRSGGGDGPAVAHAAPAPAVIPESTPLGADVGPHTIHAIETFQSAPQYEAIAKNFNTAIPGSQLT